MDTESISDAPVRGTQAPDEAHTTGGLGAQRPGHPREVCGIVETVKRWAHNPEVASSILAPATLTPYQKALLFAREIRLFPRSRYRHE